MVFKPRHIGEIEDLAPAPSFPWYSEDLATKKIVIDVFLEALVVAGHVLVPLFYRMIPDVVGQFNNDGRALAMFREGILVYLFFIYEIKASR